MEKRKHQAQEQAGEAPRKVTQLSLTNQGVLSEEALVHSLVKVSLQAYQEHLLEPSALILQRRKVVVMAVEKEVK